MRTYAYAKTQDKDGINFDSFMNLTGKQTHPFSNKKFGVFDSVTLMVLMVSKMKN